MNTNKFQYWPSNGQLGSTKFTMPTNAEDWPSGDALVGNFVYSEGKLVDFIDTKGLTPNTSKSTTIPYDYVNIELSFTEDAMTINRGPRNKYLFIKFNDKEAEEGIVYVRFEDMSEETKTMFRSAHRVIDNVLYDTDGNVIGEFDTNTIETGSNIKDTSTGESTDGKEPDALYFNLDPETMGIRGYRIYEFNSDLSNLKEGKMMFGAAITLNLFSSNLDNLEDGTSMFFNCQALVSFNSNLPNLIDGGAMFCRCYKLDTFSTELPNLVYGDEMFTDCHNLTSFSANLNKLTMGYNMFNGCSKLTSFTSDLSSLTNGYWMFEGCRLNTESVQIIADTIKDVNGLQGSGEGASVAQVRRDLDVGIGAIIPNEQEEAAFNTIASKGWTLFVNGSRYIPTSPAAITTIDETGQEISTPIPFYAKPVPSDEEHARYTDEQGNFFNIVGAQFIYGDDLSTYGMFTCEADAAANMRLTKIEKPQTFKLKKN